MPSLGPGRSRGQEGGAVGEAVSSTSFGETACGAPLSRRLFSAEDADSPRTFSDLVEPSPNDHLPLTLSWSPAGTPESVSEPPDALSRGRPLRSEITSTETCEPEDSGTPRR